MIITIILKTSLLSCFNIIFIILYRDSMFFADISLIHTSQYLRI